LNDRLNIETLNPHEDLRGAAEVAKLLIASGLDVDGDIQVFVVARDRRKIVACAGLAGDIVKCVTIAPECRSSSLALRLMSEIQYLATQRGHSHLFLYTKPDKAAFFSGCGFHKLVEVLGSACLMENTPVGVKDYCDRLKLLRRSGKRIGCIVVNANPFTLGHLYLIRRAEKECDWVHVFVVSEDASAIAYCDRLDLVRSGLSGLGRVTVHGGSRYLVSKVTFPCYFIKDTCVVEACSTAIDLLMFRKYIAPALCITHRYVGSEPFCELTRKYNADMHGWLEEAHAEEPPVHVVEIPRFEMAGRPVSASQVRRLLTDGNFEEIASLVPTTTLALLRAKYAVHPEQSAEYRAAEMY
jgi:[citrate (pro-3S)-lyase] ligase